MVLEVGAAVVAINHFSAIPVLAEVEEVVQNPKMLSSEKQETADCLFGYLNLVS